jgi:hypothetical protein
MKTLSQAKKELLKFDAFLIKELERRARKILKSKPHLIEFICGMGDCFFTTDNIYHSYQGIVDCERYTYTKPIRDLLDEFDHVFHLSGHPMRFTATGKVVNNW